MFLEPGTLPFTLLLGVGGTTCESVSITKDIAGLSFNPAFVDAAIVERGAWLWRGAGMTRLNTGD